MVTLIFKSNHVVHAGYSGTMVECRVLENLIKLISGICDKAVKVGVLGIHVFLN